MPQQVLASAPIQASGNAAPSAAPAVETVRRVESANARMKVSMSLERMGSRWSARAPISRGHAFDNVQTIHACLVLPAAEAAAQRKIVLIADVSWALGKTVAVQHENDVSLGKTILGLNRFAKRQPGPFVDVVAGDRLVHMPLPLREMLGERAVGGSMLVR